MAPGRNVVMALSYYAPYVSGLTESARLVAEGLVEQGFHATIVACQHDPSLPLREVIHGVEVIRTPVVGRVGKAVISPSFAWTVARVAKSAGTLNLHLPLPDAGAIALLARHPRLVVTYQCDAEAGTRAGARLQARLLDGSHRIALRRAQVVCPSSVDYAEHSRLAALLTSPRSRAISPPTLQRSGSPHFRETAGIHVGFVGRIVEEKGLSYLVDGFRAIADPEARLLIAGDSDGVAGGSVMSGLSARISDDPRIRILGFLSDDRLGDLYASIDVFAFPSINSFEAFGITQVEAMRAGVPVVASDLPGVREPVLRTGFGRIVPPRDAAALTAAFASLAADWSGAAERKRAAQQATEFYSLEQTVAKYRGLFEVGRRRD